MEIVIIYLIISKSNSSHHKWIIRPLKIKTKINLTILRLMVMMMSKLEKEKKFMK
jgi:hypothetical protein